MINHAKPHRFFVISSSIAACSIAENQYIYGRTSAEAIQNALKGTRQEGWIVERYRQAYSHIVVADWCDTPRKNYADASATRSVGYLIKPKGE